jgi:hypothetical protein
MGGTGSMLRVTSAVVLSGSATGLNWPGVDFNTHACAASTSAVASAKARQGWRLRAGSGFAGDVMPV